MKNTLSSLFLLISLLIYSNPYPINVNVLVAPETSSATITINEGATVNIDLSNYTTGSPDTYTIVSQPVQKTSFNGNGSNYTYVHNGSEAPSDSFTFKATNGDGDSNTSTITINVTNVNDAPTVDAISKVVDEGSSIEITVIGKDAENTELTITNSNPTNGTVTKDATSGVFTYTHNGSDTTSDSFTVTATEKANTQNGGNNLLSGSGTVSITITAVNDAPIVNAATISVDEGNSTSGIFSATDSDSSALTSSVTSIPSNGTVTLDTNNPLNYTYTHDGSETTTDTFTYNISDGALSSSAIISVTINAQNDAPAAANDTYYISAAEYTITNPGMGLLRNDVDPEENDMTTELASGPSSGTVTLNANGTFTYIPITTAVFNNDSFTYVAKDASGATSAAATVTFNLATLIPVPDTYNLAEGALLQVAADQGLKANDVDSNNFSIDSVKVATAPKYGTLTLNKADGSFTYQHDSSENRRDTFEYKIKNSNGDESEKTFVTLFASNVNDAPTSTGTTVTLNEGAESTFDLSYTDTDNTLNQMVFTIASQPTNGNLIDNGSGNVRYVHNGGETTSDSFTYTVGDGELTSAAATASITVTAVNDLPVASAVSITVAEGGTKSPIALAATDVETANNNLTFKLETAPTNGTVTISNSGVWTYTHNGTETTSDSFTYSANDGTANGSPATVSVTVTSVNSSPVTTAASFTLNEAGNITYDLQTNTTDSDTGAGTIKYIVVAVPTNGALTDPNNSNAAISAGAQIAGSTVTYTHNGGETTSDSFTFKANDTNSDSNTSTATITVAAVNDAPTINASSTITVNEKDKVDITILGSDVDSTTLTYTVVSTPSSGTLTATDGSELSNGNSIPSGILTYTSTSSISSNATDSFQVKANDGTVDSATATINIAITAIDESKPQIVLDVSSDTVSEAVGNVTVTASLVSNSFYSAQRDMDAAAVSAYATNSLGYQYIGEYGGHKYYYKDENVTNSVAKADALAKGGYLVVFETSAEENWLLGELASNKANQQTEHFWIGLNYKLNGAAWKWINGATYNVASGYTNWDTSWPQDQQNQKGATQYYNGTANGNGWENRAETQYARYIIEFDSSVNASANTTVNLAYSGSAQNTNGDSTNDSGDDWTINANSITIANGQSSATATVTVINDTTAEGTEPITITGTEADASVAIVKGSKKTLTINIQDNEDAVATMTTSANKVSYTEGTDESVNIVATLDYAKSFASTIALTISGTATAGTDFTSTDEGYLSDLSFTGMNRVYGIVIDGSGNYYAGDASSRKIWKMTSGGTISSIGSGSYGDFSTSPSTGSGAKFKDLRDMDIDSNGKIYFIDQNAIRILNPSNNEISYVAGSNNWSETMVPSGSASAVIATDARFRYLKGIAVNAAGTIIYVTDENTVRKIYTSDSDNIYTNAYAEDFNNIKVVNVGAVNNDWGRSEDNVSASSANLEGPRAIDIDSNGDVLVGDYYGIKKFTFGSQSGSPKFLKVVEKGWSEKYGLVLDSANNIYFGARNNSYIYKYVASSGSLVKIIDSSSDEGTVDGALSTAKIARPMGMTLHPTTGNLVFVQYDDKKARTIDFSSKIRIPAGQTTGTYVLNIKDESFYEDNETIKIVAAGTNVSINTKNLITESGTDYLSFDSTTTKATNATDGTNGIILVSDDSAPTVQVVASETSIAENGGVSKVSFQIGGASESGTKMDLDDGLKGEFPYIGNYQDHKYYIAHEWLNWTEAKDRATALGGYLLTINSEAENNFIKNNLGDNYKWDSYWIGFNDIDEEGTFVWANGSDSTYVNWNGGEPNNAGDEDAVEYFGNNGRWNDLPKSNGRFFIIEFSGTISAKDVVIPYVVTRSTGFSETSGTDATFTGSGNITISAGQSKAELTVTGVNDSENENTETITYTITDNITDGTYDASNSVASVSIIDDEAPAVTWATSAANVNENGGSVTITATSDKAKTTSSKLNLTITDGGATRDVDYSVAELQKVSTLAGSSYGFKDGTGTSVKFDHPGKITADSSGNIYVADYDNNVIRKVTSDGVVSTYAGNGDWDHYGETGNKMEVGFSRPSALAFNNAGNELFIAEEGRNRIRKIDASSNVSLVSGNGDWGDAVGDKNTAQYNSPRSLVFDSAGNLYVAESHKIKKLVVDGGGNWTASNFVGSGEYGTEDGTGDNAKFRNPYSIVIDKSGDDDVMYVADENRIRKVTIPGGVVTTYANMNDNWGHGDGTLASAQLRNLRALTIDSSESSLTMYAADQNKIKKITAEGVETITGDDYGFTDGNFDSAEFKSPRGMVVTTNGIYIADTENHKIRKIDLKPSITIAAGATTGSITINGIDDQLYESNDEAFTVAVQSVSNVSSAVNSFSNIVTKVISNDSAPTIKLSASDDVVDENGGTVNLVVSLADAFSSAKSDMNASEKADFYYLGEYNGSKYYSSKDDDKGRLSYSDALSLASTLGGQLAVVTSAGENDFITNKIYEKDPEFNMDNREWLNHWIGHSYDSTNSVWKWTNDAQSDYTNWGWDYNPDYIDRFYTQIRYRGLWFNGQSNWHSQFVIEFSSAISDLNATAVIEFGGTGAKDGTDYTTSIGVPSEDRTVTITKGQPSATVVITGVNDSADEAIETITTTMKTPGQAVIAQDSSSNPLNNTATISISDDEAPAVTLSVASATIGEVASDGVTTNTTISANIDNPKLNAVDISLDFTSSGAGIAIFGNDFGSNDLNRVTTHAGDGNDGYLDGDADEAEFSDGMKNGVVDASGNVYLADEWNNVIRKITPSGEVSTYAGTGYYWGDGDQENTDGDKLNRTLTHPNDVKINGGYMYIVERNAHAISRIKMSTGVLSRYVGKRYDQGDDNGNETEARFNRPKSIAFDSNNVMYVVDADNSKIRKVVDNGTNRIVTDFAGSGNWGENDGDALEAELSNLRGGIVVDSNNNVYVTAHDRIRKISADGSTVSTVAGEWHDYADGYGTNAKFRDPSGLAIDENDNIYVGDANNHRIRKLSDLTNASGAKVETISGTGDYDYGDGTQDEATYREPRFVAYGGGALFVVDVDDNRIRKVQLKPKMTIPAGQNSVTYNLKSINDVVYETDETIRFTSNTITGGTLANSGAIDLTLKSDELIPKIELDAESLVLDEADGTLELEVYLTDATGATSFWEETELPSEASNDFEFMGEFEGHKYYFSRYSSKWADANQNALSVGGQLLVIDSQEENEFISSIMIHNGTWLGTKREQGEYGWSNVYGTFDYQNFDNWDNVQNGFGYALTYGNKWYVHDQNDYRHYIVEYGPVTSSELPSTVDLVFGTGSTATKGNSQDGTSDYKSSAESFSIAAGSQSAIVTLTGLQDTNEEPVETIQVSIANPGNVELGAKTSLEIKISDDEEPVVTFATSATSIAENNGSVVVTANLSNAKLNPTTVAIDLTKSNSNNSTATAMLDYTVSSIFGYNNLAGKTDNPGSANGKGEDSRFDVPLTVIPYLNGSFLVADYEAHTIREIKADGTVCAFIGSPYNRDGSSYNQLTDVSEVRAEWPIALTADLNTGNVFFSSNDNIHMYIADSKKVITLANSSNGGISRVGGLHFVNNILYFSDMYQHYIGKLTIDESGNVSTETIAGSKGNNGWITNDDQVNSIDDRSFTYPSRIFMDASSNKMYVTNYLSVYQEYWSHSSYIHVVDFNTNQIYNLPNIRNYVYGLRLNGGEEPNFRGIDKDSEGNLYISVSNYNIVVKVSFLDDGSPYVANVIQDTNLNSPTDVAVSGASLGVTNAKGSTIGKVGLGATIEIPAMQTTSNITLGAFKDPWFEEDEIIDINVAGIENGTAASTDISEVTIVEATRLTLVDDAPFEGVEDGKVSWGDYDQDGDMDLALMGQSSTGTITNVYINNNGTFENTNQNFTKFIGGDIEFVDVNQDGWLDVAVSGNAEGNVRKAELYINQEGNFFELMEDYQVEGLSQSDMEWGDLDNDGDPDLIMSGIDSENQFRTYYYTNLGDFNFLNEGLFNDSGVINGEIDIVDADQDGDNDLFTNGSRGDVTNLQSHRMRFVNTYYRDSYDEQGNLNDGDGFNVHAGYKNGNTIYADIDGDGELDYLAIGEDEGGNIERRSNLNALNDLPKLKNVDFDFADYNNDGQSDLIIAGEDPNTGAAITKLYTTFPAYFGSQYGIVESDLTIQGLRESSTDWIDYDKDGDLDLFLTGLDDNGIAKAILYKAENNNNLNTAPNKISNLTATHDGVGSVEFKWDKPTDNSSNEFRYDLKIGTGYFDPITGETDNEGPFRLDNIIYANSDDQTGSTLINIPSLSTLNSREVILNPGTYYASVQAIDGGNMGGVFSDTVSITLDYEWKLLNLGGIIDRRLIPSKSTQLQFMDMDGDGDKDLISTNVGMETSRYGYGVRVDKQAINIYAFENEVFVPVYGAHYGESNFEFGDFNNDGQTDLIVAIEESSGTRLRMFLNTRLIDDAREDDPETTNQDEGLYREYWREHYPFDNNNGGDFLESVYNIEFAIKDLDNDGLVEIIGAGQSSKLTNEATTVMAMFSIADGDTETTGLDFDKFTVTDPKGVVEEGKLSNLSFASYDFGDVDNDGDFDFLISGYSFDGYKTLLFENKRALDENGVAVQPIEVYFEEKANDFVSVKEGTADFVDFDADGKLDVLFSGQSSSGDIVKAYKNGDDGFTDMNVGLPAVRDGRFVFGDFDSNGFADVVYSGTVSGQGKVTKMSTWNTESNIMVDTGYDLSMYEDANIGVADFDGDLDADLVITGKNKFEQDNNSYYGFISDVVMNVRGFAGPAGGGIANDDSGDYREGKPLKKSVGVKKTYGLNARPFPPTEVNFQRSRLGAYNPDTDNGGNKTSVRTGSAGNEQALFEMVITWSGAVDTDADGKKTPSEGLTYSVRIGTTPGGEEILAAGSDIDGVKAVADAGNAENNLSWKVNVPMGDYYVAVQSIDASFIGSTFSEEKKYTVTSAFKLGDSNGDDGVNILDLTTNLDYILGNNPKVFVQEVADVNGDGKIDVTDISAIVNIILNGTGSVANGSNYDPYDWEYFSNKPVGNATLVYTNGRIYLENEKPVTSLQFSMDATIDYELSEDLKNLSVVNFVEDGKRTFLIYSYNNQPINELTNVVFDYLDINDNEDLEINNLRAGTNDGLVLDLKYSDERFFDSLDDSIRIYPNPANSNVNLLTDVTKNVETLNVNIYNVLGVSVYSTTLENMGRLNDLDVSMLASGIYTVQVRMITKGNEEIISVHKLIKK
tara:strand:- start:44 stop:15682 length:15639 start_codon:yes stop_codon:yes gene_type:complete